MYVRNEAPNLDDFSVPDTAVIDDISYVQKILHHTTEGQLTRSGVKLVIGLATKPKLICNK